MKFLFSLEQYAKSLPRYQAKRKLLESSQFGKRLIELRKLFAFYGKPSQKYLKTLYSKSNRSSQKSLSFFHLLESRLDVVLFRAHFYESIASAKQQITIGNIEVNNKRVTAPKYKLLPGDIIRVVDRCEKKAYTTQEATKTHSVNDNDYSLIKQLKRKKGWRFQRSPFFLSLFAIQFEKAISNSVNNGLSERTQEYFQKSETNNFKVKKDNKIINGGVAKTEIPSRFLKTLAFKKKVLATLSKISFAEFSIADFSRKWCFENAYRLKIFSLLRENCVSKEKQINLTNLSVTYPFAQSETSFTSRDGAPSILSTHTLSPLTKTLSPNKKQIVLPEDATDFFTKGDKDKQVRTSQLSLLPKATKLIAQLESLFKKPETADLKNSLFQNMDLLGKKKNKSDNWLFLMLFVLLKKKAVSSKKKSYSFFPQKNQLFFKTQSFFRTKKSKPLHLEISYKSRAIVFLFPPQRVCFENFIDVSQITK